MRISKSYFNLSQLCLEARNSMFKQVLVLETPFHVSLQKKFYFRRRIHRGRYSRPILPMLLAGIFCSCFLLTQHEFTFLDTEILRRRRCLFSAVAELVMQALYPKNPLNHPVPVIVVHKVTPP